MKKGVILLILICSINVYSQVKDSIIYIFPDKVEQKLYDKIKDIDSAEDLQFEFYLQTVDKGRFRVAYTAYSRNQSNDYWAERTNRFILINKSKYPLIFDYDSMFSTSKLDGIGEYGNREGTILRSLFIYDRYNITFDKNGEYIKEDWGYEKNIKLI